MLTFGLATCYFTARTLNTRNQTKCDLLIFRSVDVIVALNISAVLFLVIDHKTGQSQRWISAGLLFQLHRDLETAGLWSRETVSFLWFGDSVVKVFRVHPHSNRRWRWRAHREHKNKLMPQKDFEFHNEICCSWVYLQLLKQFSVAFFQALFSLRHGIFIFFLIFKFFLNSRTFRKTRLNIFLPATSPFS